jgi:malate synthase
MAGLYSRADVYVADLDGATAPTWESLLLGQRHLRDAVRGMIAYLAPDGREVELAPVAATLMLQPRAAHLVEPRMAVDDEPVSASLFDLGLYLFHNGEHLHQHRRGPFISLGGVEGQLEARWWHEVLLSAESILGLPEASIRASLGVDTIAGAFEVEEMLYELRGRAAGLVCDRWNYVFSFLRTFGGRDGFLMPDTSLITMERHFLEATAMLVVQVGHRRGVPVIGPTSTQIPIPSDPIADRVAMARLMADKTREVDGGFDGSRVGHPDFVRVAMGVFEARWSGRRTAAGTMNHARPRPKDLLTFPDGPVTEAGVRHCVRVALRYLEAWLRGVGCLPVRHEQTTMPMVEVARVQLWHWVRERAPLDDGREITEKLYGATVDYEMGSIRRALGEEVWAMGEFDRARSLLDRLVLAPALSPTVAQEGMDTLLERETSMR